MAPSPPPAGANGEPADGVEAIFAGVYFAVVPQTGIDEDHEKKVDLTLKDSARLKF